MDLNVTLFDEDGNLIQAESKRYCSCCGLEVDDYDCWCAETFKNHAQDKTIWYPVLCNSCFDRIFRY